MKLTKDVEAAILKAYHAYWDSYLKGDIISMASILDENYTQVGSAETEVFLNKPDAVKFLYDTIDQIAGKAEIRNQVVKLDQMGKFYLVHDLFDAYVLDGENWIFYAKFRATTLMHEVSGQWKFLHQHSSVPDIRTQDGENIAVDKISAENLQLKDAIKRRTVELEQKNRELEIGSSLERVRTVAMGMNKADDMLDVCQAISLQLELLGVKDIRNVQTAIFYVNRGTYMNYEYYSRHHKTIITETVYTNHEIATAFANKMLQGKGEVSITVIEGEQKVQDWLTFQKTTNVFIDTFLETATSLNYYWHSLGPVALGISTYSPLTKDELNLFQRFINVFELAYTRYLDIEQAVTQAREAQIEASLERVRAEAMAMRNPDDLTGICEVLYRELHSLGFTAIRNAMISILDDKKSGFINYDYSDEIGKSINQLDYNIHPVIEKQFRQIRSSVDAFSETSIKGQDLEDWKAFRKKIGEKDDPRIDETDALYYYFYSIGTGAIGISTFSVVEEEMLNVLKRFRNVFNLSYQRYTDIALAEAQAREVQIELALERVRARTMAMQNSDELSETAVLLFHQLMSLGLDLKGCGFNIWEKDEKTCTAWMSGPGGTLSPPFKLPLTEDPLFMRYYESRQNGEDFWVYETGREELVARYEYLRTLPVLGELLAKQQNDGAQIELPAFVVDHVVNFSNGNLIFVTHKRHPEEWDIFKRFGKVFEQTYTRFLDLQKAEAQARESQIEAALERVRSRTMAMQKSDELMETAVVLFDQLKQLGEHIERTIIGVVNEEERIVDFWATRPHGSQMDKMQKFPIDEPIVMQKVYGAWRQQKKSIVVDLRGEELESYFQFLKGRSVKLKRESFGERRVENFAFFSKGFLGVISADPEIPANVELYERFAAVFEQTYTRFLDLQKAEAQAREAQIETALERVRSRSMGMQKSDELKEVIKIVYQQLTHLKINVNHAGFVVDYTPGDDWHFWIADEQDIPSKITHPYFESVWANQFNEAKQKGADFFATNLDFEEKNKFYNQLLSYVPGLPEASKDFYLGCPGLAASTVLLDNVSLYIENFSGIPYSDEENKTLIRFGKVFQQTYTRFLDLQKAEAQARESQIEAALEKVRSRSLAMHKSDELLEVVHSVFDRLKELDIDLYTVIIFTFIKDSKDVVWWLTNKQSQQYARMLVPYGDNPYLRDLFEAKESGKELFSTMYSFEQKNELFHHLFEHTDFKSVPEAQKSFLFETPFATMSVALAKNTGINITSYSRESFSESDCEILKRFTNVFDQAYTRFLDLQKAEAQARESQIEMSLERIRSASVAMHSSEELKNVIRVLTDQLTVLGFDYHTANFITNECMPDWQIWISSPGVDNVPAKIHVPYMDHILFNERNASMAAGKEFLTRALDKEEKDRFFHYLFENTTAKGTPEERKQWVYEQKGMGLTTVLMKNISLSVINYDGTLYTNEENDVIRRLASVFEQTYTRFLDLQKAEAQAREAQIEAALEKIRSSSLAMHRSDELKNVMATMFNKLTGLEVLLGSVAIQLFNPETQDSFFWIGTDWQNPAMITLPFDEYIIHADTYLKDSWEAWNKRESIFNKVYSTEQKNIYFEYVFANNAVTVIPEPVRSVILNAQSHIICLIIESRCALFTDSWDKQFYSEEKISVLRRTAKVFDQAYTRFLDLQKAEAQARESKIEAALERVRGRAMAMQSSDELREVVAVVFKQLQQLELDPLLCVILIVNKETNDLTWWSTGFSQEILPESYFIPHKIIDHPFGRAFFDDWKSGTPYTIAELSGETKRTWEELLFAESQLKNMPAEVREIMQAKDCVFLCDAFMSHGALQVAGIEPLPAEKADILKRFAKVIDLTYTRVEDLHKAEERTLQAVRTATLDRVRAEIASMRTADDLQRITPLIWRELTTLDVPFFRCGVFIMKDNVKHIDVYLSTPEGKSLAAFHLPFDSTETTVEIVAHWRVQKVYTEHWDKQQFVAWTQSMIGQGQVKEAADYQANVEPPESLSLQFVPFTQGMLYIGSVEPLTESSIGLAQSLANAFSIAYARYEDFNKLESAKEQIEKTLVDLKQTQVQLVQSEKMASLGELTAGIAHEIQNPLNFVNNFSEVSNELIEELKSEKSKDKSERNEQLEDELLNDIAQNLEKINHHGKRADAIVKGMLQHSRSSNATREPTDINKLADEYLRLAYHGLRAKDKTFNAIMKTGYDESIGDINIIPQEIGRAILNLITNAFYAVNERKKSSYLAAPDSKDKDYEPTVSVSTKKVDDKVLISVKDNGNGIPQKALDKIFQPFFTTKPTGQGTGLGLSLAYDIIRAHGGEINVETKEGVSAEFTIQIPT